MKKEVTKNVTIDDLAAMVANGFSRVEDRIGKVEEKLENLDENLAATRRDVLEIGDRFVPRYEFHDLLIRFDRLEKKVTGK